MFVSVGKRAGPSHRDRHVPCQDAYALHRADGGDRIAAAVADGLGSRSLSHLGSQAAARAASESLGEARRWDARAVHRAFRAARTAVRREAKTLGVSPDALATTLQVVGLSADRVVAGIVGDGAVLCADATPRLLLAPGESEYANTVAPITSADWQDHLRVASTQGSTRVMLFTDGLTRLLLTRQRGTWQPYAPFFDAFLPRLRPESFDEQLVPRFLATDQIDTAWDDDKCLVVMGLDATA